MSATIATHASVITPLPLVRFSVVTPSFNQARYLPETLASVRTAAERAPAHAVEHWVIDGDSTDGSREILENQTFARWISERDAGQSDAINKGWRRCTGDIFAYLCSDDLWLPETVSLVAEAFEAHPGADIVYGDYYFLEGDSGWRRPKIAGEFSRERLIQLNFLSQPATFLHRRVYDRFGGLDPGLRYCMDNDYWLRISDSTKWHYLRKPLAVMRQHADSKTSSQLTRAWWETARMAAQYGAGRRYWWKALRMQCGGQVFYMAKRRLFRWVGHRKGNHRHP